MALSKFKWGVLAAGLTLAGCNDTLESVANKAEHPLPSKLVKQMKASGMSTRSPIMMRIFKQENALEVWKQKPNGRYEMVVSYEICKWSGKLGPKYKEGDRQAPEGFYRIHKHQMNPNSSYYLSFNMGFPNSYDRSKGRTGSNLMVHGACSSAGCYSMTDEQVLEIFGFARDAFKGGQKYFQVQAYPFRMTPENMARNRDHKNFEFWQMIKEGYDHFEITKRPPSVEVCDRRYVFNQIPEGGKPFKATAACPPMSQPPALQTAYAKYQKDYNKKFAEAVALYDKEADKQKKAELAKLEADQRQAAREAERAAKEQAREEARVASTSRKFSPVTSLFSKRDEQSQAPQNTALSSNLYQQNQANDALPVPTSTQTAPATNVVPTPVPTAPVGDTIAANPEEENLPFWKRLLKR